MPRFHVVFFDSSDSSVGEHMIRASDAVNATLQHPWIILVYKDAWILQNLYHPDFEQVRQNIWASLGYAISCVNLDEEIMKDLNGGDLSASSQTPQSQE